MGTAWLKNFVGWPGMTDEQLEDIPNPDLELAVHITYKTTEVACLLGGLIVAPVYRLLKRADPDKLLVATRARRIGLGFALVGIVGGPLLTRFYVNKRQLTRDGVYDRCFRLRHNKQLVWDRATTATAAASVLIRGVGGFVPGVNIGSLGFIAYTVANKRLAASAAAPKVDSPPPAAASAVVEPSKLKKAAAASSSGSPSNAATTGERASEGADATGDGTDETAPETELKISPWLEGTATYRVADGAAKGKSNSKPKAAAKPKEPCRCECHQDC